jgi:hypothetical protein
MSPALALNGEEAVCELLIAPFTTCGEPIFEDSERCSTHYIRSLEDLVKALAARRPATEAEEAIERVEALLTDRTPADSVPVYRIRAALAAADGGDPP